MIEIENDYDVNKACRICLLQTKKIINLYTENDSISISAKFKICISSKIFADDGLPAQICLICFEKLEIAFNLVQKFQKSDAILRAQLSKNELNNKKDFVANNFKLENNFKCFECKRNFRTKGHLKLHMKIHINSRYFCNICNKYFTHKGALSNHLKIHSKSCKISEYFACRICFKKFNSQGLLYLHLKKKHNKIQRLSCILCKQIFSARVSLINHIKKHMNINIGQKLNISKWIKFANKQKEFFIQIDSNFTNESIVSCDQCGRRFLNSTYLMRHQELMHSRKNQVQDFKSEIKPKRSKISEYLCHICGLYYTSVSSFKNHTASHDNSPIYNCLYCEKKFKLRSSKNFHMKTHNNKRKYHYCVKCDKRYVNSSGLKYHERIHTEHKPHIKKFSCKECNKQFEKEKDLQTHIILHNGDYPFICSLCNRGFNRNNNYKMHLRRHLESKQYICHICGYAAITSSYLNIHINSHLQLKSFNCEFCNKCFASYSGIYKHKKRFHVDINDI